MVMNQKECEKISWSNLICYPGICLEGPREITKFLSQDKQLPGWKPGHPKYETAVI